MRINQVLLIAILLGAPSAGQAQMPQPARFVWVKPHYSELARAGPGLLGRGDRDYRYTGFYVGLGLGAAATLLAVANCSDRDNGCSVTRALVLGPIMTGVLGLSGALIGSIFPKEHTQEDSSGTD